MVLLFQQIVTFAERIRIRPRAPLSVTTVGSVASSVVPTINPPATERTDKESEPEPGPLVIDESAEIGPTSDADVEEEQSGQQQPSGLPHAEPEPDEDVESDWDPTADALKFEVGPTDIIEEVNVSRGCYNGLLEGELHYLPSCLVQYWQAIQNSRLRN